MRGGNTSAGVSITLKTTIAGSGLACCGTVSTREVTLGTTLIQTRMSDRCGIPGEHTYPDTSGLPVVWDGEGDGSSSRGLPAVGLIGNCSSNIQVGEHLKTETKSNQ